jgi:hypothetical protein
MKERQETRCPNCTEAAYREVIRLPQSPRGDWIGPWTCDACEITWDSPQQWVDFARSWMNAKVWWLQVGCTSRPKWMDRRVVSMGVKRPSLQPVMERHPES